MKISIAVGAVIAIIALVVCLVPLKTVAYTVTVDYQDTETYYEDVPYEEIETYYETEPLSYEVVESYTDLDSYEVWRSGAGDVEVFFPIGCVVVKNTDSAVGTFRIQFTFYVLEEFRVETLAKFFGQPKEELVKTAGSKYYGSGSLTLEPGETGTVKYNIKDTIEDTRKLIWDYMLWDWEYTITEATKTVEKQRTVTKYRQVEKQRTVTKQRPETRYKKITLLEYLMKEF